MSVVLKGALMKVVATLPTEKTPLPVYWAGAALLLAWVWLWVVLTGMLLRVAAALQRKKLVLSEAETLVTRADC